MDHPILIKGYIHYPLIFYAVFESKLSDVICKWVNVESGMYNKITKITG